MEKKANDTSDLSLFHFESCRFCLKVRSVLRKLDLDIDLKDAELPENRDVLLAGGGKVQVPCLLIQAGASQQWMYESSDIIDYLEKRYQRFK